MSVTWVRVSNAVQDPVTGIALGQDQVVRVLNEDGDWLNIETLEKAKGRLPRVLATPIANPCTSSDHRAFCATAAYEAQAAGDITFAQNAIVVAEGREEGGWLRGFVVGDTGKPLGSSGPFPASFVVEMEGFSPPTAVAPAPSSFSGMTPSFTTDFSTDTRFQHHNVSPYARAVFAFTGEFSNELSFNADEIIHLTRRIDTDWLEGKIGNRVGIFPQSFVQIVVPLEGETTSSTSAAGPSGSGESQDGIGYAVVRYDYNGQQKDELSVKMGDSVRVLQMVDNDWVQCRDPSTDAVGIVPVSFLELYLDEEEDDPKHSRPPSVHDQSFGTFASSSFYPPSSVPDWRTSTRLEPESSAGAIQPSTGNHGWATFGDDWLAPEKKSAAPPARPPPPKAASLSSPDEVVSINEMFGRPDMPRNSFGAEPTAIVPQLTGKTDREKRDKVLEDLINTELQFITDVNCFTEAVDATSRLTTKQKTILKSGCAQIVQLAGTLVQALTNEQAKVWDQQSVGSCFLHLRKSFSNTYCFYFRNIEHVNSLMNQAMTDLRIEEALSEVLAKMKEGGSTVIDATTAVSRPVQRCVKYPLFLNELAKYTPIHHHDHPKLLEAVKMMSTLGQKMNESKRRKELARKYSEDQPQSSSIGDMLSKLTIHSIKKKSNRFTYRMGSSLGVVKVARDMEFDQLVSDLDACERRLVRFNYVLVIYKKKIFFETRQLIQKRLIDIRKKQVSLTGMDIDRQVQPFHDAVKNFAESLNLK